MNWLKDIIKKHKKLKKFSLSTLGLFLKFFMWILNKIYGVEEKKVVFISFGGKSYSDNPRAISEKLYEMRSDFAIVWIFNNPEEKRKIVPDYVKCVKNNTYSAFKELATAKFWVDNFGKAVYTYKSKAQIYIQTWHGDRGFKKILYDSHKVSPNAYYIEQDICDLMLSGSDYYDQVIRSAFKYAGKVMKVGSPRNDLLFHYSNRYIFNIKKSIGLPIDKKIVMYAPTLRRFAQGKEQEIADIDLESTLGALENKTGQRWICLIRAHSAVRGFANSPENSNRIIDVTRYEDMKDLLLITDLLIPDYSSSAGDFALLKKPIILYQPDRDKYLLEDRTFYFDIDTSPFTVVFNQDELLAAIQELDEKKVLKQCEEILEFYGTVETGHASRSVVEYILSNVKL